MSNIRCVMWSAGSGTQVDRNATRLATEARAGMRARCAARFDSRSDRPVFTRWINAREISDLLYFDFDRPERAERKAGGSEKENSMMEWIMVRIATPMPAEMSPYSIAVTPASSFAIRSC
jgi:hypothetical protein